jgi:cytochrome b561
LKRYDGVTIGLHWLTAALVAMLFAMTLWWTYAPRTIGFRFELEDLHVSLGIVLSAVLLTRLAWRVLRPSGIGYAAKTALDRVASCVHWLLYGLLAGQLALGVVLRGLQGADLSLFGLIAIPLPLVRDRPTAEVIAAFHYWIGWTLIIVAGGHAAMALFHHYVLRDDVLRRMLLSGDR